MSSEIEDKPDCYWYGEFHGAVRYCGRQESCPDKGCGWYDNERTTPEYNDT